MEKYAEKIKDLSRFEKYKLIREEVRKDIIFY